MNKCANPNCDKELGEGTTKKKEYCSGQCQQYHNSLKRGLIESEDELNKAQSQTITLHNGIEIRNDAMGKEISGYLNKTYIGMKR